MKETLPTRLSIFISPPNTHGICVGAEEGEEDYRVCVSAKDWALSSVIPHLIITVL